MGTGAEATRDSNGHDLRDSTQHRSGDDGNERSKRIRVSPRREEEEANKVCTDGDKRAGWREVGCWQNSRALARGEMELGG